ncbi:MAG: energy transducer TonB [Pontibacterium sp.]
MPEPVKPPVQTPPEPVKKPVPLIHKPISKAELTDKIVETEQSTEPADKIAKPVVNHAQASARFEAVSYQQQVPPVYPRIARKRGQQGTVWLRAYVKASGEVGQVSVSESSGFRLLDKAALKAVRQWRFTPAQQDGHAQAAYVKIPVTFLLDKPQ